MRNIRSIFTRLFFRIAISVTAVCALIGALSNDYHIIAGGWAMVLEMAAVYCMHRQGRVLRNYCSDCTDIRFWSVRSLVAAVICTLVIAAVIAALKHFWGITFVARGIILGIVFFFLVCEWFQCRALLDRATAESRTSSSSKN